MATVSDKFRDLVNIGATSEAGTSLVVNDVLQTKFPNRYNFYRNYQQSLQSLTGRANMETVLGIANNVAPQRERMARMASEIADDIAVLERRQAAVVPTVARGGMRKRHRGGVLPGDSGNTTDGTAPLAAATPLRSSIKGEGGISLSDVDLGLLSGSQTPPLQPLPPSNSLNARRPLFLSQGVVEEAAQASAQASAQAVHGSDGKDASLAVTGVEDAARVAAKGAALERSSLVGSVPQPQNIAPAPAPEPAPTQAPAPAPSPSTPPPSSSEPAARQDATDAHDPRWMQYVNSRLKQSDLTNNVTFKQDRQSAGAAEFEDFAELNGKNGRNIKDMKYDPVLSPDVLQTTMVDRLIFIATTFILRALALYMLEWAIYTRFLNSFQQAFALYFGVYCALFLLLVILVNAQADDKVFRLLFYYINTQGEKAHARILVHILAQVVLLPIPYVVADFRENMQAKVSFEERRRVMRAVERISFFIWLMTSLVALKL